MIISGLPWFVTWGNNQQSSVRALAWWLVLVLAALPARACPVRIPLGPIKARSAQYQVYRYAAKSESPAAAKQSPAATAKGPAAKSHWQKVPWQPLRIGSDQPEYAMSLSRYFGAPLADTNLSPCGPRGEVAPAYQLRAFARGTYQALYLFACREPAKPGSTSLKAPPEADSPVTEMRQAVVTSDYYYRYHNQNKLLFASLALAKATPGSYQLIASVANQQIVGNFKNFFTMTFDNNDFHVKELSTQRGPVGVYSQLNFLLRVLGMKLDMDLVTDVYFYPEGMYTPMILHMPIDAKKYLKRGSGIIYSWQQQSGFRWEPGRLAGEAGVPGLISLKDTAGVLAKYCQSSCYFSIRGQAQAGGRHIHLHFRLPRYLVAKGFYPVYFDDDAKLAKALGLKVATAPTHKPGEGRRTGFFFEAFDLRKGSHRWDLAIDTRGPASLRQLPCGELAPPLPLRPFSRRPTKPR